MITEACCIPHPDQHNSYLLFLELNGPPQDTPERKPVHLALALDTSSSMGGPRLACALEAVRSVVNRLQQDDVFGLVTFDRTVRTLFGPALVGSKELASIHGLLAKIRPGVGTALYAAMERSYKALSRVYVRSARPHVIVLTDGYPSVGPNRPESFYQIARNASNEGIITSTMGIGLGFDEQCVSSIASGGGGRYSFVDKESDIPGSLHRLLADLYSVAIENVTLRVSPSNAVREASLLHRYTTRISPDGFLVETGPIGVGSPRRLLFELKTSSTPPSSMVTVGISTREVGTEGESRIISISASSPDTPLSQEAIRELRRLELATCENNFWEAVHRGHKEIAEQAYQATAKTLLSLEQAGERTQVLEMNRHRHADQRAVLDGRLSAEAQETAKKRSHHTAISIIRSVYDSE